MIRAALKYLKSIYHFLFAFLGAAWFGFPSRKIFVVGVTGTKGKTTTAELVNAILEQAGFKSAVSSTLHFKIADREERNLKKMTMPGRAFLQKFLKKAVQAKCDYAVIEMTSEGALQHRHRFIELNALIFTNLAPEHIEAHGSYENYRNAKLSIARQLTRSGKPDKIIVVNGDDKEADKFLATPVPRKIIYSLKRPPREINRLRLSGEFNRYNAAAAVALARALGISSETISRALNRFIGIRGRMEEVIKTPFKVIVDYAHTPDSLQAVYTTLSEEIKAKKQNARLICVLSACGGGRDKWKRPVMGRIAAQHCQKIILTDEDPYDENPEKIINDLARAIPQEKYEIVVDRRLAINKAMTAAAAGDIVIITGKGTDPFIMGPRGSKIPWDDAAVTREEFGKLDNRSSNN